MTSLQGIMGKYYALNSGETPEVAQAILEHYLPRFAGDGLPRSKASLVIGIADRLDSLSGLFAAGLAPTGTKDPFAQRRAAIGLVQELMSWNLHFDLRQGLDLAAEGLPVAAAPENLAACVEFLTGRLRSALIDQGYRYDVVDAVLAVQQLDPAGSLAAIRELSEWVSRPDWSSILQAYARCVRITREYKEPFNSVPAAMVDPAEKDLYSAVRTAESAERQPGSMADFFAVFLPIIPVINRFFEAVLVMAEDPQVRANRLGMLQSIAGLTRGVVDLSKLEGF
jgi:glycyl-tRNA synthetase